jgi:hypothetical protein
MGQVPGWVVLEALHATSTIAEIGVQPGYQTMHEPGQT